MKYIKQSLTINFDEYTRQSSSKSDRILCVDKYTYAYNSLTNGSAYFNF